MIDFNILKIDTKGTQLYIDLNIPDMPYFKDVYIDEIIIDNQDTFVESGPSNNPVYRKKLTDEQKYFVASIDFREILADLNTDLLFVWVVKKGTFAPDTPCRMDERYSMNTVTNLYNMYQDMMQEIKEINKSCEVPVSLINKFMQWKAIELSVKTANYPEAIKYWRKFFSNRKLYNVNNICGCNG